MPVDPYAPLADAYVEHCGTLRGLVRRELVHRQLTGHLPAPPARVADVGGGAGMQSMPLAAEGHAVDLVDPSGEMLARAAAATESLDEEARGRVRLVRAWGEEAPGLLGESHYDAVLCHGVVMYLDDPAPLLESLVCLAAPGGIVSVLAKNAASLALRPGLQGSYREAVAVLDADRDVGSLGVVTRGDTVERLQALMARAGAPVEAWYGVRVLCDHLPDRGAPPGLADLLDAEWEVGRRDPYRQVARLLHLVGRRPA